MISVELTAAILMPRISNFLRNSTIHFHIFFIFGNVFPMSHGFDAVPVTSCIKDTYVPIIIDHWLISEGRRNCSTMWPAQKRNRDSQETCYHIYKSCKNWCSNFSENWRIVALELLELTRFFSPNLSIYSYLLYFVWCWGSVVMLTPLN